jgi:hypothetical protein
VNFGSMVGPTLNKNRLSARTILYTLGLSEDRIINGSKVELKYPSASLPHITEWREDMG